MKSRNQQRSFFMSNLNKDDEELNRLDYKIGLKLGEIQKVNKYAEIAISRLKQEEKKWSDRISTENLELLELTNIKNELVANFQQ